MLNELHLNNPSRVAQPISTADMYAQPIHSRTARTIAGIMLASVYGAWVAYTAALPPIPTLRRVSSPTKTDRYAIRQPPFRTRRAFSRATLSSVYGTLATKTSSMPSTCSWAS